MSSDAIKHNQTADQKRESRPGDWSGHSDLPPDILPAVTSLQPVGSTHVTLDHP
jgi:hypothetical protein